MKLCSVCGKRIENEKPAILVMTALAHPKYICDDCERCFDTATASHDPEQISKAIEEIGNKLVSANSDDKLTLDTVGEILAEASERCNLIRSGDYDFSNDDANDDSIDDDVPEELRESEEDKALDEADEISKKKVDRIFNWICGVLIAAAVGFVIYRVIDTFL